MTESSADKERSWDEVYRGFVEEAPHVQLASASSINPGDIPWLKPELVKEGQDFCERNLMSVNLSAMVTLFVGFSIKSISTLLFRNQNFNGVDSAKTRWNETLEHMTSWYSSDILTNSGKGFKKVQVVRKIHLLVLKKFDNEKLRHFIPDESKMVDKAGKEAFLKALQADIHACADTSLAPIQLFTYNPPVLMSQFDLALTQFGFMGFVVLFPRSLGIKDMRGIEGFIHMWALIGKLLGIEDRFNLGLYPDMTLYRKIFSDIAMGCVVTSDLSAVNAHWEFGEALRKLFIFISPKSFIYYVLSSNEVLPEFNGEQLYKTLSWWDVCLFKGTQVGIFLITHFDFIRKLMNRLFIFQSHPNKPKKM